jgi:hypothetical protein
MMLPPFVVPITMFLLLILPLPLELTLALPVAATCNATFQPFQSERAPLLPWLLESM